MRKLILLVFSLVLFASCNDQIESNASLLNHYVVETRVPIQKGQTEAVLELFKSTNLALVQNESDWVRATFSKIENEDVVIVRAIWKNVSSYRTFSASTHFRETMGQFGKYFTGPPEVSVSRILFEM